MNRINSYSCLIRRCLRQDLMAQVEDMALGIPGIIHEFLYSFFQFIFWEKQGNGVKVSLDRMIADPLYRLTDIDSPVKAKYICTGCF